MDREQASAAGRKERLEAHLREVARERDPDRAPAGHAHVAGYIRQAFARHGPPAGHAFEYRGRRHENIVLDLPGRRAGGVILVGAHYDGVPGSPGADDNGSAIAVLLELARDFAAGPAPRPLRLVAFDLEERDLAGSRAYAADLSRRRESLHLMIALEMVGYCDRRPGSQRYPPGLRYFYPDRGDFIGLIGNLRAIPPMRRLARALRRSVPCEWLPVPGRGHLLPDTRRSDHSPFWDLAYPALMVTDTANLRNPHYHTAGDCLETLDMDFLTGVCTGLIAGLRALA
jgi:Zn-dependent M28 family amino/carboxypeptidase